MVAVLTRMFDRQMHIVYDTLSKLGISDKVIITVFNKQDKSDADTSLKDFKADYTSKNICKNPVKNTEELLCALGKGAE